MMSEFDQMNEKVKVIAQTADKEQFLLCCWGELTERSSIGGVKKQRCFHK